jgi:hypothetical protein
MVWSFNMSVEFVESVVPNPHILDVISRGEHRVGTIQRNPEYPERSCFVLSETSIGVINLEDMKTITQRLDEFVKELDG